MLRLNLVIFLFAFGFAVSSAAQDHSATHIDMKLLPMMDHDAARSYARPGSNVVGNGPWGFQYWQAQISRLLSDDDGAGNTFRLAGGWRLRDGYYMQPELVFTQLTQTGDNAQILGLNLIMRSELHKWHGTTVFFDYGAGLHESDERTPIKGTRFSFNVQAGLGWDIPMSPGKSILIGTRWLHYNNLNFHGSSRNPELNFWETYVGAKIDF